MIFLANLSKLKKFYSLKCRFSNRGVNLWDSDLSIDVKHKIEEYWSKILAAENINYEDNGKDKYYVLSMFPYPSGHLHMGHVRVYTISDSIARFQRMNGRNVIHPIGWDAFGLPAENAAIDRNISPMHWTKTNITHMKQQLKQLGCSFEWSREIATCDPRYYKWTQHLFLKLFEAGLAYQKEALVNWDPVDCTVLADEQVDENECSWRSGAKVEKKLFKQWFIRSTKFAKALQDGLDDNTLHDWRDIIKLQKHWLGNCEGIAVDFRLKSASNELLTLWTDQPEHLEDVAFIVLSKNHVFTLKSLASTQIDENTQNLHISAIHPITNESIPIFHSNLIEFADGADGYLGIPSINEQDANFAEKYQISYTRKEILMNDRELESKRSKIIEILARCNAGGHYTSSKLKDWLISRQRYWGTPIPIIHCQQCGCVPVPAESLPVILPDCDHVSRSGSILHSSDWKQTSCPKCGAPAERETDTMDTFVDSSWYFLRYLNRDYDDNIFDIERAKRMTPVDLYIGGKEHAVLHLYYARFVSHFLHHLGMLPEREPFKRLLVQGMVMGRSYRIKGTGKYLPHDKVNVIDLKRNKAESKETGEAVVMQWEKMSKSKCNGTDPSDMFQEYGIDTTRLLILADVAPTSHRNWNSSTFPGVLNWQRRLWLTIQDFIKHRNEMPAITNDDEFQAQEDYMFDSRNYYVKGATFNYCDSQQISVGISKMQGLTNSLRRAPDFVFARSLQFERALTCQVILLAPLAPHFASELWAGLTSAPNQLNHSGEIDWKRNVLQQTWPQLDWEYQLDLVCKVNGDENAILKIPRRQFDNLSQDVAIQMALQDDKVQHAISTNTVLDVKYVLQPRYEAEVNIITSNPMRKKAKKSNFE